MYMHLYARVCVYIQIRSIYIALCGGINILRECIMGQEYFPVL